jgi:alpha-D-xyloside xylohydrolase
MNLEKYLEIKTDDFIFRLEKINNKIFRIRRVAASSLFKNDSLVVLPEINAVDLTYEKIEDFFVVKTDAVEVRVDIVNTSITFQTLNGTKIFTELDSENKISKLKENGNDYSITQKIKFDSDEGLYGLGQYQDGVMNYQNQKVILAQSNRTIALPFLTSTKGYGILWDNYSWTEFESKADNDSSFVGSLYSEIADGIDYYFVYGGSFDDTIAGYRYLTGQAPMYGKWAYGYWQCKERYQSFDELEDVVKEYRNRKIPIDNIIQDWKYWGELGWSALDFDEETYPEPERRIAELHEKYNCKVMLSIWPSIGKESKPGRELIDKKMMFPVLCWNNGYVYDVYNPEAQDIYWKYTKENLFDRGVDAFWIDGSEPEFFAAHTREEFKNQMYQSGDSVIGSLKKYLNPYALKSVQPVYEGQRKATDKKRVYILTRSGFSGQQRYAASSWSGDIAGSWDVLKKQISGGINFCMAGVPYWTHDIGGFFTNRYKKGCLDPEYRELYLRWFQFGAFTPLFRSHGTNTPREMWRFGDKGDVIYDSLVNFTNLRYRLMPYIYSCAGMVTQKGYTLMRGLPMDFADDKECFGITDQFMFGPSIMACPVTERMYNISDCEDGETISEKHFSQQSEVGLLAEYFGTKDFRERKLEKTDPCIDFDWSGGTPEGVSYYDYSIRWSGYIESDVSGIHEMTLVSCAVKVTINNKCLLDELGYDGSELNSYKFSFNFEKDKKYSIKVEYKRAPDTASICLKWKKPGKEVLTVPENSKERTLYLANGCEWYDYWNNDIYEGGQTITVPAPLETMPLFIKSGSIITVGPEIQYASEKPADPMELYIYTGVDGSFILYEDEGDNYNYEKGYYSEIKIEWINSGNKLIIGERKGAFEGMLKNRTFIPVIIKEGEKTVQEPVEYCGKRISVDCSSE